MNEKTCENKSVLPKRISFRPTKAIDEAIKELMKTYKIGITGAIEHIFREWQILTQQKQPEKPSIETDLKKDVDEPYPECGFRVRNPRTKLYECINKSPPINLKHFSKFGLLPRICNVCKSVKIVEKATDNRRKTVKKPRLEYIYCEAEGMKIPIKANQGKCRRCNLNNFRKWAECQEKHRQMEVAYQNG